MDYYSVVCNKRHQFSFHHEQRVFSVRFGVAVQQYIQKHDNSSHCIVFARSEEVA